MNQNIYHKILQRLLRESSDLGEIEFSPIRTDGVDTAEPDTDSEKIVLKGIVSWMKAPVIGRRYLPAIRAAASTPKYAPFFNAPKGVTIYRGMSLSVYKLKQWLGVSYDDKIGLEGEKSVNLTLGPGDNGGASWTYEPFEARKFSSALADEEPEHADPEVILEATTDGVHGNFIDLYSIADKLTAGTLPTFGGKSEAEVLQLGPVRVHKIHWWNNHGDDD